MILMATAGPATALLLMLGLHLFFADLINPMTGLLSDYAVTDTTTETVFALGMMALAAGCVATAWSLTEPNPSRTAATRVLLIVAAAGLVLATIFPTDLSADVTTLGGEIHRWSTAVVFTSLPVAGWILTRRGPLGAVGLLARLSGVFLVAYLLSHPTSPVSALVGGEAYFGLLERIVVVLEILLVIALANLGKAGQRAAAPATRPEHALNG
ncbi:DUF998 domain-containing protein [Herbidospora galbida]|uniref:DUF998 domain-containing protein n=1 Tax=Herbidospora galbida TaxID=2575442 RepID=A0A4U3LZJ1_9ACTN|nr:DUF998 domain-containing protein [Herbidospora galbida]TKK81272.1 DUF998 domain-containing protein [Herbidospora galbida]